MGKHAKRPAHAAAVDQTATKRRKRGPQEAANDLKDRYKPSANTKGDALSAGTKAVVIPATVDQVNKLPLHPLLLAQSCIHSLKARVTLNSHHFIHMLTHNLGPHPQDHCSHVQDHPLTLSSQVEPILRSRLKSTTIRNLCSSENYLKSSSMTF